MILFLHPLLLKLPSSLLSWGLSEWTVRTRTNSTLMRHLEENIFCHHPDPVTFLMIHACARGKKETHETQRPHHAGGASSVFCELNSIQHVSFNWELKEIWRGFFFFFFNSLSSLLLRVSSGCRATLLTRRRQMAAHQTLVNV